MRSDLYKKFSELEETHWWFTARKTVLETLLHSLFPAKVKTALDIGSGPGINVNLLSGIAESVSILEASVEAVAMARRKFPSLNIIQGAFPGTVPERKYDLVTMLDVLEHIENDRAALSAVRNLLNENGRLVLAVPCFKFLWSEHDEHVRHFRRYTKKGLVALLEEAGFAIERATYFNTFLFPAISAVRLAKKALRIRTNETDYDASPTFMNSLFAKIFRAERFVLPYANFPVGVSLFCAARKIE